MKKKVISVLFGILCVAALTACQGNTSGSEMTVTGESIREESGEVNTKESGEGSTEESGGETGGESMEESSEESSAPVEPTEEPTEEPGGEEPGEDYRAKAASAYKVALQDFAFSHVYPDGEEFELMEDFGSIEENHFAIGDVNGDGKEELVISFSTGPMASMRESVYCYDEKTNSLRVLLQEYPAMSFYDNGMVEVEASHNHSMGEAVWPYTIYVYDESEGTYVTRAEVSSWNREWYGEDYEGNPFPDAVDQDGNGIVFRVYQGEETLYFDEGDYQSWHSSVLANAKQIDLTFRQTDEKTINGLPD